MSKIQIVHLPGCAYFSQEQITKRLPLFLKKLSDKRKDRLETEDSASDRKNWQQLQRTKERAEKLLEARYRAFGLSKLKQDQRNELLELADNTRAVVLPSAHRADEIAAQLHEEMPWMAQVTEAVWHQMRSRAEAKLPVTIDPLILCGSPGIGKSHWARRFAELLDVPSVELDAGKLSSGFSTVGTEKGWSTAQPGRPVEILVQHHVANSLIVVDEICKASISQSKDGTRHSFSYALLSLLEPKSAGKWECLFYRMSFDMTHLNWVMTENRLSTISEPLLSRCQVIALPDLTTDHLILFAQRLGVEMGLAPETIGVSIEAIAKRAEAGAPQSLRDVKRLLRALKAQQDRPDLH
jgi:hypothetical protein